MTARLRTCHRCKTDQAETQQSYAGWECIDRKACLARVDERLDRAFSRREPEGKPS